jgi:hypothetical protein
MHYPYLRIPYLNALSRGTTEEDLIAGLAAVESNSEHLSMANYKIRQNAMVPKVLMRCRDA